ncbi:Hypothetical predicted protein [Mytilus galloprovincialis]|uniref:RING-type domain-containing protein n=1 Tax=Mytilus galloprovincialis TaxID=29158 RepID=A0A8B6FAA4_MYTGA|nr:Hypothetical predicted protein [Mytilus galloprovincialis]
MIFKFQRIVQQRQHHGLPRKGIRHREYSSYLTRKQSFNSIQFPTGQSVNHLAEAGFFYAGHKDFVRCFSCGVLIKNWKQGQDPLTEHRRKSSGCDFLQQPRIHEHHNERASVLSTSNENVDRLADDIQSVLNLGYDMDSIQKAYQLCHETTSGLRSVDINQLTNRLLDLTVVDQISEETTQQIQDVDVRDQSVEERTPSYIQRIEQEVHQLRETLMCKICMDNSANVVIMPCGHFTSCLQCSSELTNCPQCRVGISSRIKVFL